MRKIKNILFLLIVLITFILPLNKVSAHGGVENEVGNITVSFFQDPFSPITGKNVVITFLISNKESGKRIESYPAILKIKETVYGHEEQDKTIYTKDVKTDPNGVIAMNYTFPNDKIYDIELEFPQIKEQENSVGFLLEPRSNAPINSLYNYLIIGFLALIAGVFIGHKSKSIKNTK